jgi:hypothetical protein
VVDGSRHKVTVAWFDEWPESEAEMTFTDLVDKAEALKHELLETQILMQLEVEDFTGTIKEAIEQGMVRYNFATPSESFNVREMKQQLAKIHGYNRR